MQPRLNTSKKWTSFPKELTQQIKEVFTEGFGEAVKNGEILVEGRIFKEEIMLRVGYLEKGRLAQANFEVSLDFNPSKQNAMEQIQFAMDCAASMMEDYLQNADDGLSDFPRNWQAFEIANRKVFLKVTTVNEKLEAEADRLLGETAEEGEALLRGEEDEESLRSQIHGMLGLNGDDDDEDGGDDDGHGGHGGHKHGPGCKH